MQIRFLTTLSITVFLIGCGTTGTRAPDLLLLNGNIKTPDGWQQALAVTDGRISAIGELSGLRATSNADTRIVDLKGRTVLPGFYDMHVHPVYGGISQSGANYTNCLIEQGADVTELQAVLSQCVGRLQPGDWLTGGQWDAAALEAVPHKSMLDKVTADFPVLLNDTSGHSGWANSRALELAGVTADTPDPEGGIIERDATGEPTGVLRELAVGIVRQHIPPPNASILEESLTWALDEMLSVGIVGLVEASNGFVAGSRAEAELWTSLADKGQLKQRVRICMNWIPDNALADDGSSALIDKRRSYDRERLKFDCIKLFMDGVPTDSHTAAMIEAYESTIEGRDDDASRFGMLLIQPDDVNELVTRLDAQGLTVKFHAAGDRAVRAGLDAIEAARKVNGMSSLRHTVGHCTYIHPDDVSRGISLAATYELSPYLFSPSPIADDILYAVGAYRTLRVWPFRDLLDAGSFVVPGSDWSVVPSVNPWIAVETMITRQVPGGGDRTFGSTQGITLDEAIDLFTIASARQFGLGGQAGVIQEGYLADLVVLDRNPWEIPVTDLHKVGVEITIIDGEMVYQSP